MVFKWHCEIWTPKMVHINSSSHQSTAVALQCDLSWEINEDNFVSVQSELSVLSEVWLWVDHLALFMGSYRIWALFPRARMCLRWLIPALTGGPVRFSVLPAAIYILLTSPDKAIDQEAKWNISHLNILPGDWCYSHAVTSAEHEQRERVGKEEGDGLLKEDAEIYISTSERAALVGSQQRRLQWCRSGKMESVIFSHRETKLKYATKQQCCILM